MIKALLSQSCESKPGFSRKLAKWAIGCSSDGRYTGLIPLSEEKGRFFCMCPHLSHPELIGGGESRSQFLLDGLNTLALFLKADSVAEDQRRFKEKHSFFVKLLREASTSMPALAGAATVLENEIDHIRADLTRIKAKPTDTATVLIDGVNPLEMSEWHEWWEGFRKSLGKNNKASRQMRCFGTGELVEPAATHPKIKGLAGVGGLGTGDVLVGFDKDAFTSYGLEQSANAAMSDETATSYSEALNKQISTNGKKMGSALWTYWFSEQTHPDDDPFPWLWEPPEQAKASAELRAAQLLDSIQKGKRVDLAGNHFQALLLSGAAGRVMVREFMQGSFESLVRSIGSWFQDLEIVSRYGDGLCPLPKFMAVAGSLVRDLKDFPSPWLQRLFRAAITGIGIPSFVLAQAVVRNRIGVIKDEPKNHARMAILKAFHVRKGDRHMQPFLNCEHPNPAYHCGRLLALFARLQRSALGDVGAGVVQRYYTAASQTPGLILGRLAANAKNHLSKLEGGLAWWYEDKISEVFGRIKDNIPRTLTLEEQSLFALGYYQQLAERKNDGTNAGATDTKEGEER